MKKSNKNKKTVQKPAQPRRTRQAKFPRQRNPKPRIQVIDAFTWINYTNNVYKFAESADPILPIKPLLEVNREYTNLLAKGSAKRIRWIDLIFNTTGNSQVLLSKSRIALYGTTEPTTMDIVLNNNYPLVNFNKKGVSRVRLPVSNYMLDPDDKGYTIINEVPLLYIKIVTENPNGMQDFEKVASVDIKINISYRPLDRVGLLGMNLLEWREANHGSISESKKISGKKEPSVKEDEKEETEVKKLREEINELRTKIDLLLSQIHY